MFPFLPLITALPETKVVRKHSFCTNVQQDILLCIKLCKPNTNVHELNTRQKRTSLVVRQYLILTVCTLLTVVVTEKFLMKNINS